MDSCVVLYDDWQMQCCGIPFEVGDEINWLVSNWQNYKLPIDVGLINYYFDNHSSNYESLFKLTGTVVEIQALHCKYAESSTNPKILIPVAGCLVNVVSADGWDKPVDNMPFSGYIIKLKDTSIREAKESEVTFK